MNNQMSEQTDIIEKIKNSSSQSQIKEDIKEIESDDWTDEHSQKTPLNNHKKDNKEQENNDNLEQDPTKQQQQQK